MISIKPASKELQSLGKNYLAEWMKQISLSMALLYLFRRKP